MGLFFRFLQKAFATQTRKMEAMSAEWQTHRNNFILFFIVTRAFEVFSIYNLSDDEKLRKVFD